MRGRRAPQPPARPPRPCPCSWASAPAARYYLSNTTCNNNNNDSNNSSNNNNNSNVNSNRKT